MDKVQVARDIETINKQLLDLCNELMGAQPGTEQAEALNAVANAIMFLENYLYPEYHTDLDEDLHLDDGE
jgi:hypothetical protein